MRRALVIVASATALLLALAFVATRPGPDTAEGPGGKPQSAHAAARAVAPAIAARPAAAPAEGLPTLHLAIAPQRAVPVGASIDLATTGPSAIPPWVALNITFDPRVLRPRSSEEIDYADASIDRGSLQEAEAGEGVVRMSAGRRGSSATSATKQLGLLQFEAIGPGTTTIRVSVVPGESLDAGAARLPFAVPVCDCQVNVY